MLKKIDCLQIAYNLPLKTLIIKENLQTRNPPNAMLAGFLVLVAHWRLELQTP